MTNVASLYGGPTGVPEVNDLAVEVLRDMLAKADMVAILTEWQS